MMSRTVSSADVWIATSQPFLSFSPFFGPCLLKFNIDEMAHFLSVSLFSRYG